LEVGSECVGAQSRLDEIRAFIGVLDNEVTTYSVGIVTRAAGQRVAIPAKFAVSADELVVAIAAREQSIVTCSVKNIIAGAARQGAGARTVVVQRIVPARAIERVIAELLAVQKIVTRAADQCVVAGVACVQTVIARAAGDDVVEAVAAAFEIARANE